ncbi:MAG: hypothetical protein RBU37_21230, partial [Myxococcota bacterium]|nr:hypothetical protein [Myxococcota bacterium]
MSSILALVSKKAFDSVRVNGRSLQLGELWPVDQYLSKTPALRTLEAGGALFLVTVRPPDERLWLLAILQDPRFDGSKWTCAQNTTPVREISHLVPKFRFANGTGLNPAPGKLGMSLQTPRVLSAEDEQWLSL